MSKLRDVLDDHDFPLPDATRVASLPDKLSALIRVALADLAVVEADPSYRVDMGIWAERNPVWAERNPDGTCSVCLAGAVMTQSLGAVPRPDSWCGFTPDRLGDAVADKMRALNFARTGQIFDALTRIGVSAGVAASINDEVYDAQPSILGVLWEGYDHPPLFRDAMTRLAALLEKRGQ